MKLNTIKFLIFASAAAAVMATGCEKGTDQTVAAKIEITQVSTDTSSITVRFTPDENAARWEYAISENNDLAAFTDGTLESIVQMDGNEAQEIKFENLEPTTIYNIYARAYTNQGVSSGVNAIKVTTDDARLNIRISYLTDNSAGFLADFPQDIYSCRYYLGTAEDKERFINGEIEGSYVYTASGINYFDLEPTTDYILYAVGTDRGGAETSLIEVPASTYSADECPNITLQTDINIYEGNYTATPNDLCGKIILTVGETAAVDIQEILSSGFNDDIVEMLVLWGEAGTHSVIAENGTPAVMDVTTYTLENSNPIEVYVVIYDKNNTVTGVKHFSYATPDLDSSLPSPNDITIDIANPTAAGAIYTFNADETVFGYFYESVEADWYDAIVDNGSDEAGTVWTEYYLPNIFYQNYLANQSTGYLRMGNGEYTWAETAIVQQNTRYYAAAIPFNENGPREGGWGNLTLEEFWTLSE